MYHSKLMAKAVPLLRRHRGSFREIADACDVSYSWLSKVSQGKLPDAAAGRLERLVAYLEQQDQATDDRVSAA